MPRNILETGSFSPQHGSLGYRAYMGDTLGRENVSVCLHPHMDEGRALTKEAVRTRMRTAKVLARNARRAIRVAKKERREGGPLRFPQPALLYSFGGYVERYVINAIDAAGGLVEGDEVARQFMRGLYTHPQGEDPKEYYLMEDIVEVALIMVRLATGAEAAYDFVKAVHGFMFGVARGTGCESRYETKLAVLWQKLEEVDRVVPNDQDARRVYFAEKGVKMMWYHLVYVGPTAVLETREWRKWNRAFNWDTADEGICGVSTAEVRAMELRHFVRYFRDNGAVMGLMKEFDFNYEIGAAPYRRVPDWWFELDTFTNEYWKTQVLWGGNNLSLGYEDDQAWKRVRRMQEPEWVGGDGGEAEFSDEEWSDAEDSDSEGDY